MRRVLAVAAVAALGACALDDERAQVSVEVKAAQPMDPDHVRREVVQLYEELASRMEARGVTLEQMQAAVDSGDAERVRELFGFTPEEYEAANARALALTTRVEQAIGEVEAEAPDGWDCRGMLSCSFGVMAIAYLQPTSRSVSWR